MKSMAKSAITTAILLLAMTTLHAQAAAPQMDMPELGKWLLGKGGAPAHWLGQKYKGKELREPINIIIVDAFSPDAKAATAKLMKECKKNGYEEEAGHSSGYYAIIGGVMYAQIPNNRRMAFADKDFFKSNNHGRIMGPASWNGKFVYAGAFSREAFKLFDRVHHRFVSFNAARDDFCAKLSRGSVYALAGSWDLGNTLDGEGITTADHDGRALVLNALE